MASTTDRLARLRLRPHDLTGILRGVEKESLRVDPQGRLALTPHPRVLGSALTHTRITTDYAEALLELITGTHGSVGGLLEELDHIHRYVASQLGDESMWNQSMPPWLPAPADIPIAWYGRSNSGMLKHVYRRGLAERYGKPMQCIAGVHYNYSLPDTVWDTLGIEGGGNPQEARNLGYMALIRNFTRHSWLLMYLFGASPAVATDFLTKPGHGLEPLRDDTSYLPYATSLRMSDLGYQNKAQSDLQLCYNDLDTFLARLYKAVTTSWPAYEAIGTHRDGEWIQLNTNILQIENEYYSSIRPKRSTGRGERPATALRRHGIQYIEVRCLDIDPWSPLGLSAQTAHFMDTFLLFCAVEESRHFPSNGFCMDSHDNFSLVVKEGRRPGLVLIRQDKPVTLQEWGEELLEQMAPYAELLDTAYGTQAYGEALAAQQAKLRDSSLTPSARLLAELREQDISLRDFTRRQSLAHHQDLLARALPDRIMADFHEAAAASLARQAEMEAGDTMSFEEYVARYEAALHGCRAP